MRIVMLIENTAVSQKLLVEHGMSVYIENGDSRCLFGTGSSTKLINNAKRMKLYPENIDAAIIPHNHLSYTGGIDNLLQVNPKMKIFALNAADDELEHECFGVIFPFENRNRGCVILGGCAHCGLPNMIRTVYKNWGSVPVLAILTGLHFMGDSSKKITVEGAYIDKLAKEIKELNVGAIYTCHCTGLKGYEELREKLGNQLQYLQTGEELNF